ncbi:MAG: hypothetical protein WC755_09785 [Candidatus Woesearchaeota archaeon]|jgi:hypothetical protein
MKKSVIESSQLLKESAMTLEYAALQFRFLDMLLSENKHPSPRLIQYITDIGFPMLMSSLSKDNICDLKKLINSCEAKK